MSDFDEDWEQRMLSSKILDDPNLPEGIKKKYAFYENNPFMMIVSNIPPTISLKEIEEYFDTLITSLDPKLSD